MNRIALCLGIAGAGLFAFVDRVQAQAVVPDGTLNTIVNSSGGNFTITGGTSGGSNLFHSFREFSIPTGGFAYFNNTGAVRTIFSRVTGTTASSINGIIAANGNASLFLLNPNGILFGPNASLSIGGSFIGSTASGIRFDNGAEFLATETPLPAPLLTISAPIGLQMGSNPGTIALQSQLEVNPEQTLALIGGDIAIQDSYLYVPDGHIELDSVGSNGSVLIAPSTTGWTFGYGNAATFRNIAVNESFVEVSGDGGGTIQLRGNKVDVTGGAQIYTLTYGARSGGGVTVQAAESVTVAGLNSQNVGSGFFAGIVSGSGNGGDLTISTPLFSVVEGALVGVEAFGGQGNLGRLTVRADRLEVLGTSTDGRFSSVVYSLVDQPAQGRGGDITLNVQHLQVGKGGRIYAETGASGQGGNLTINARSIAGFGNPQVPNSRSSVIGVAARATGNAGIATITTEQLTLTDDTQIYAGTSGAGNGGSLKIQATEIYADRANATSGFSTGLNSSVAAGATGNAGAIEVQAQRLTLLNGAQIFGGTAGVGNGGRVTIKADEITAVGVGTEAISGIVSSGITATINRTAQGNAGNLEIEAGKLSLSAGAEVSSSVLGTGTGGDITIRGQEILATGRDSGIYATVNRSGTGNAGSITIMSDRVVVKDGAEVSSSTFGVGNAGSIRMQATESIQVDRGIILSGVGKNGVGQGGQINLQTRQLQLTNRGNITTEALGQGNAGEILLRSNTASLEASSEISTASSNAGNAGKISMTTDLLTLDQSKITSSNTGSGNAGTVDLAVSDRFVARGGTISTSTINGIGGTISLSANQVELQNSQIDSSTSGRGNAGKITLNANSAALRQSQMSSQSTGSGNAGTLSIFTSTLAIDQASTLSTATTNEGQAGDVLIRSDRVSLRDNSQITSRSSGTGNGGTIDVTANRLSLDQGSALNAQTASGDGGNIFLSLANLLTLNNQSLVSAEAGGIGNGGNITIQADYILGLGNSDIVANAFQGRGGNIGITTQGIFGFQYGDQLTPNNDITASSQFGINGSVQINVLSLDPNSGLVELPVAVIDPNQQIAKGCQSVQDSSFIVSGRGGLPTNPLENISPAPVVWGDVRSLSPVGQSAIQPIQVSAPLMEASTWRRNPTTGQVELIAERSMPTLMATCAGITQ
ncbi:two-partner secretion domain-containing protein [Leptolyngbya sp. NIES-2104]|uniref:two-partner secretion domain-containing protein n=1 Tax=Leptolyngbya sp. NIES-2104 TaxID=1552121 RepID=UPI0006EC7869|nr:filamentous hemagglutinin N-terminal domain-containing protein [Leptolyngbya sp. NIES-2104]GAP95550.1 putative hemagglutinin-related protein [Leptolyngbya sp. NIES-2104]